MSDPTVSESAACTLYAIGQHIDKIAAAVGGDASAFTVTADSWRRASANMWSLLCEGGSLSRDGDLSLYVVTSYGMHVGVIFFRDRAYDSARTDSTGTEVHGCLCHGGAPYPADADRCSAASGHSADEPGYRACMRRTMPVPGTWSLHS